MPARDGPEGRSAVRAALVAAATAAIAWAAGGGDAFWLCAPAALLLAAGAHSAREGVAAVLVAVLAAALPGVAMRDYEMPSLLLAFAFTGAGVAVLHSVRARFAVERTALRGAALTDELTRVLNRRGLAQRVEYEVARHARLEHSFVVVALDLDGFKLVNDRFGHHAGDEVLRDVAAALGDVVRDQDSVARLGGDEFCVLAPETDRAGGERLAARVSESVARVTAGFTQLAASVGVAVFPEDGRSAADILQAADAEQVAAKRRVHARRTVRRRAA